MEKEEATGATHRALNVTSRRRGTRINSRITVLSPAGMPGGIQRINNDWTPLRIPPLLSFSFFRLVHSAPGERESGGEWGMCEIAELGDTLEYPRDHSSSRTLAVTAIFSQIIISYYYFSFYSGLQHREASPHWTQT